MIPGMTRGSTISRKVDQAVSPRSIAASSRLRSRVNWMLICERPSRLVELIRSLSSFETYSEQCSVRSELDAALHQDLQQTAGRARTLLEQALFRSQRERLVHSLMSHAMPNISMAATASAI